MFTSKGLRFFSGVSMCRIKVFAIGMVLVLGWESIRGGGLGSNNIFSDKARRGGS